MGKKNKTPGLGKSLIRDRFGKHSYDRPGGDTFNLLLFKTRDILDNLQQKIVSFITTLLWQYLAVMSSACLENFVSTAVCCKRKKRINCPKFECIFKCGLHTSALNDGYEWGRLNLQSVTEQNNLEDFLSTAELAGTEFAAEKMNIKVIQKDVHGGLPHGEELMRIQNLQKQHKDSIRIPRRPHWEKDMTASEVDQNERAAFLEWRRSLALLQEVDGLVLTPYEKNLDFWRQLWRVIERSDVVVQIVDARNPLLFYCPDLERYVHEVDSSKVCVVLVNKADFLTQQQRDMWADYFNKLKIRVAFWSAVDETKRQEEASKLGTESVYSETTERVNDKLHSDSEISDEEDISDEQGDVTDSDDHKNETTHGIIDNCESVDKVKDDLDESNSNKENVEVDHDLRSDNKVRTENDMYDQGVNTDCDRLKSSIEMNSDRCDSDNQVLSETVNDCHIQDSEHNVESKSNKSDRSFVNSGYVFTGPELLDYLRSLHRNLNLMTVGMVGYPNVGKSSTINAILKMKKVPVSATPGRTKHFQTLYVDKDLMLCDCPGLVFPSFVTTKADLVISGILPIDQMRDHVPPTSLICRLIPRHLLEKVYGIIIAKPKEGEDSNRPPTAEEFLNAYGAMRGFMTSRGLPDCPRSSRYVLKDFVNGKLLYCNPPPSVSPEDFNMFTEDCKEPSITRQTSCEIIPESSAIDKEFFDKKFSTSHTRTAGSGSTQMGINSASEKPWRKHNNKRKKEKLRKVYGYLDKH